jgi:hypothetical protein
MLLQGGSNAAKKASNKNHYSKIIVEDWGDEELDKIDEEFKKLDKEN